MAETAVADVLKTFSQKITTSSVKTRLEILLSLHPCVKQSNFPEGAVKGVVRCLLFTLPLYQDKKSRSAVEDVLRLLCQHHKDYMLKHFAAAIKETADVYKQIAPCRSNAAVAMNGLGWTCVVVRECFKTSEEMVGDNFKKLVELQCFFLHGALSTDSVSVKEGSYKRIARIWKQAPGSASVYGDVVIDLTPSVFLMCMVSCLVKYFNTSKNMDQFTKIQDGFTELYVKQVVGSRTVPKLHVLDQSKQLLKTISHDTFKNTILPAVEKAMLRNPEVVILVLSELIAGVCLDLSVYCLQLGKPLTTHSGSKEESMREVATQAFSHLAHQCSDSDALQKLTKHMFAVLGGSEGKLSVTAQRVSMMTAISNLSDNGVAGTSQQTLATSVVEAFIPVLQQEVHEATLVHAVSMFSSWCAKFSTEVPEKVTLWFKTAMSSKTSTPLVKNAYIMCMIRTYHGDTLQTGIQLLPCLMTALEKGYAQPTQIALVTEALSAACLVANMSLSDILTESKLETFWTVVLDSNKMIFLNDKFLSQASDDALQCLASLTERLTLDHPQKVPDKQARQYYRGLVYCLTHGSHTQRKHSRGCVTKMLSALGSTKVAQDIIREFRTLLNTQKLEDLIELRESEVDSLSSDSRSHVISPRVLTEALFTITNIPNPERTEAESVSMETLFDAHHPCIMEYECDAWVDIVGRLGVDCAKFIEAHLVDIMAHLKNTDHVSQIHRNALSTLVRISPKTVLPILLEYVTLTLKNPDLLTVRQADYEIMNTPEGELYDKSVIASGNKEATSSANMKRESKLYSYKEQMAELALRKELEKKKGLKDKAEPKLTKKQQEVMQEQLKKESEIRAKCKQLDNQVHNMALLLSACFCGNPEASRLEMPTLMTMLLPLFKSPLTAPRARDVYIELRTVVLDETLLGDLVAQCTLRLLDPSCRLDPVWSEESLCSQATRVVQMLFDKTKPNSDKKPTENALSAPAFTYCFTLLRKVLEKAGAAVSANQMIMQRALSIISCHAQLREWETNDTDVDEFGPDLLPRARMLSLCCDIIATSGGKLQQMATKGLLDVAESGSGQEGCATAKQEEVDVLLGALQAPAAIVREAALLALISLEEVLPSPELDTEPGLQLLKRVYVAKHDVEEDNRKLAEKILEITQLQVEPELCMMLVEEVVHHEQVVREAAAVAIANAIEIHPDYVEAVLQEFLDVYTAKLYQPPPILDTFGRVISEGPPDDWPARAGIAMAIEKLAPHLDTDQITPVFRFFVDKSLADRNETVRKHMLNAAVAAVNQHGKSQVAVLLPVFEEFLCDAPDSASFDAVRQSVVILMGSLAKHLDKDDPKVKPIVGKLIETLSTPSQQVQEAVANCLPPLVPAIKADAPGIIQKLLRLLLESENFGERKGAAYGLAGLVKGLGILSLKQQDIMTKLTDAIQNKKNPKMREGALFAFEMLCVMLGRLFEPYVVHILPHLLLCFGDNSQFVREAAEDCAKAVMSKLSAHGVKLVLPSLLSALEEDSWRTKTGSVELLGAMAFCAPKQLSACLPNIVPKLTDVLTDSHLKVQKSGAQALKQIGSVIRNPEIQALVPIMLEALQDPTKKTTVCLQSLLETKFVHFIDAPSLALIMPVVQRSFQDRSTETRKMAAQIIGNMYSLTDQKDLSPYLPSVIPGLKQSLLDPVPEVRTVSAKALGAMVKGMGESGFEELVPWLMQMLTSEQSSVDRSGAAQGLSEVVGGLGLEKLEKLMPDIIQTAERADIAPHVRDGYIMMYIYLPTVFGEDFMEYIEPIIPSILQGLADENEYVRETALHAGQRLVNLYADSAIELLLPQLEKGLFDDNWRIRSSSVQLLGDLLYKISGVSGKMSTESAGDDDNFGTESSQHAILRVLGADRRNRVLAGLYMGRSDSALMVRQSALHVWKVIVSHTPKTLREILPTLFELLLGCLASQSYDKRQVAARTLGDIVRKLGEKVLPEIIPILEKGLDSSESAKRQGVCIGLSEIITSTSKEHVIVFSDSLIPTVRKALIDSLPEVRECAAQTFDHLHSNIGPRALDEILPDLLKKLNDPELKECALDGLKQVMSVKSRVVLPYLVPQLTAKPVNTRALSFLSSVAGESLTRHLGKILPALLSSLSQKIGSEQEVEEQEVRYCLAVVLSVTDDIGVRIVMDELLRATTNENSGMRTAAVMLLSKYCEQTKMDLTEFIPQLYRGVIHCFIDSEEKVLVAAWNCVNAITKKLDPSEMVAHISNVRQAVKFAVNDLKGREELPGLCLPKKGITPLLPIFREGLLNGSPELKESSSYGLGELIRRASADALKPSVVNITGPLIRILGDRFSFNVKVAILDTLGLLLGKCGVMLKPFLPQLQTTFVKALNDATRSVRLKAATALSCLIAIHTRVDPLFVELMSGVKNATDNSIRDTMLQALRSCVLAGGSKMSDKVRKDILEMLEGLLSEKQDVTRSTAAACLGAMCTCVTDDELVLLLNMQLLSSSASVDWMLRHGRSVGLSVALKEAAARLTEDRYNQNVTAAIQEYCEADRIPICLAGLQALGHLMGHLVRENQTMPASFVSLLLKSMKRESNDIKILVANVLNYVAKSGDAAMEASLLKTLVPLLVNGTKEKNTTVKSSSEWALVSLLKLREGDTVYKLVQGMLEPGMRDVLDEVYTKALRKIVAQIDKGQDDIDNTVLV